MNSNCFRLVMNRRLGMLVPAPETARGLPGRASSSARSARAPQPHRWAGLALSRLALAVATVLAGAAQANPVGPQVVSGSATVKSQGPQMTVTNSAGAILNWQSFSVGKGESTRFDQSGANSAVLNRVTGADPSSILGSISSNGKVFLVNPNGVIFGEGSRVDTQGFLASTLNISDSDFARGQLRFAGQGGVIENHGSLSGGGGDVVLVAPSVLNAGAISSQGGNVILAAGRKLKLASPGLVGISFEVQAPTDQAVNLGSLSGGAVGVFAGSLRQAGQIEASTLSVEGGKVVLKAQTETRLEAGSRTAAIGAHGGEVQVLGRDITLAGGAVVDASGTQGGGSILVGGDLHGTNPGVMNAQSTTVAAGAMLKADAGAQGEGGKVVVWADGSTRMAGQISARGGEAGGHGGQAEVSGKKQLRYSGHTNLGAPKGKRGTLLLDPEDIDIDVLANVDLYANSFVDWETINADLPTTDVVVATNANLSGTGSITTHSAFNFNAAGNLSLLAVGDLSVGAGISNTGSGGLTLVAGWDGLSDRVTPTVTPSTGNLTLGGNIDFQGTVLAAAGANLLVSSTQTTNAAGNWTLLAGGNITLTAGLQNTGTGALTAVAGWSGWDTTTTPGSATPTVAIGSSDLVVAGAIDYQQSDVTLAAAHNLSLNSPQSINNSGNLRLLAGNDLSLNAALQNAGAGNLSAYAGWDPASGTNAPAVVPLVGNLTQGNRIDWVGTAALVAGNDIALNNAITTTVGDISLNAGGKIAFFSDPTLPITSYGGHWLTASGTDGVGALNATVWLSSAHEIEWNSPDSGYINSVSVSADKLVLNTPGLISNNPSFYYANLYFGGNKLDFTLTNDYLNTASNYRPTVLLEHTGSSLDIVHGSFTPKEGLQVWSHGNVRITGPVNSPEMFGSGTAGLSLNAYDPTSTISIASTGSVNATNLNIKADRVQIDGPVTAINAPGNWQAPFDYGMVSIQPLTSGRNISLGTEDPTRLSLTQTEISNLKVGDLQIYAFNGGDVRISAPITTDAAVQFLQLGNRLTIDAPLTVTHAQGQAYLSVDTLDITASGSVSSLAGGISIGQNTGTRVGNTSPTYLIGLPDGQPKPGNGGLELTEAELHRLNTTGPLFLGDPYNQYNTNQNPLRIVGPLDITGIASQLFLTGTTISQDAGAIITAPQLSASAFNSIDLGQANHVGTFAARVWNNDASVSRFINFGADSAGFDIGNVASTWFTTAGARLMSRTAPSNCDTTGAVCNINLSTTGAITQSAGTTILANQLTLSAVTATLGDASNSVSELHINNAAMNLDYTQASAATGSTALKVDNLAGDRTGSLTLRGAAPMVITGNDVMDGATADTVMISRNGGSLAVASGATLAGEGTVDVRNATGGVLTVDGNLAPGQRSNTSATGTLKVQGDLALGSGAQVTARLDAASADQLAVSGNVALDGALSAPLANSYSPNGENFNVLSFGSRTGNFAAFGLPTGFQHTYTGNALNLYHTAGGGNGALYWDNDAGDSQWTNAINWSTNSLPVASSDVSINQLGGGNAVFLGSGDQTIHNLAVTGKSLWVNGGSLTVNGSFNSDLGVIVNGGTLTTNGATNIREGFLWGGTWGGSGDIHFGGSFIWSGGHLAGTGGTSIGAAAQGHLLGTLVQDRALTNLGNTDVAPGTTLTGSGTLNNGGSLTLSPGLAVDTRSIGVVVNNTGSIEQTGAESTVWSGGISSSAGAQFNLLGGSALISGPAATLADVRLSGSTLNLATNAQVNGAMSWQDSTVQRSGGGATPTLALAGSASLSTVNTLHNTASGVLVDVLGSATQNKDFLVTSGLTVHGDYTLESGDIAGAYVAVGPAGQLFKTSTQTSVIRAPLLTEAGSLVSAQEGVLSLGGLSSSVAGTLEVLPGAWLRVQQTPGATAYLDVASTGLIDVGGTLELEGNTRLSGTGPLHVLASPQAGVPAGTVQMVAGAEAGDRNIALPVYNAGQIVQSTADTTTWSGSLASNPDSSFMLLNGAAAMTGTSANFGQMLVAGTLGLTHDAMATGAVTLAEATVQRAGNGNTPMFTWAAAGNNLLSQYQTQNTFNDVLLSVTGSATQAGNLAMGGGSRLNVAGNYTLRGGNINGFVDVTQGQFTKTSSFGAEVTGAFYVEPGAQLQVQEGSLGLGGLVAGLGSMSVAPGSTLTLRQGSLFQMQGAGRLDVGGTLELETDTQLFGGGPLNILPASQAGAAPGKLSLGDGTQPAANASRSIDFVVNNQGVIEQTSAQPTVWSGGITSASGSMFKLQGATAEIQGPAATFGDLTVEASTLNLATDATVSGVATLHDAVIANSSAGSMLFLTLAGVTDLSTVQAAQNNLAVNTRITGAAVQSGNLALVGLLDITGTYLLDTGNITGGSVNLRGPAATFAKTFTPVTSTIEALTNEAGTRMTLLGGTVDIKSASFTNNGLIDIGAGATLAKNAGGMTNGASGRISGNGSVDLGRGTLLNQGVIAPGGTSAIGSLSLQGDLRFAPGGVLEAELLGMGQNDRLAVSGNVAFNNTATLDVRALNGFTPLITDVFPLVSYSGASGQFATTNAHGLTTNPNYLSNRLLLDATGPNDWVWISPDSGNWGDANNWNKGSTPGTTSVVTIPDIANATPTISYTNGASTVASVRALEPVLLLGGTLGLNGSSNFSAGVVQAGGALALNGGAVNLGGGSTWTGGTITGTGAAQVVVGNGATWSISGADKTLPVQLLVEGGTVSVASGTAVSASQVSNLGGHIDGNGARAMFYAGQGNSIDGSFGGGLTLGGTWTLGGHTQLSALSDGHFTYLGGSVIDGAITAGKGSTAGTLQLSFGENASAVVQANSGVIVGNHSSASVHGTLNGDVVVDTQQGNPSGLSAGANLTVAGTHNGRLSMDGAARVTVSGTQNGVVKLDAGALTLSDSVLNISDGSTWTGGTITGTGAAQVVVGNGATWSISGADKTLPVQLLVEGGTVSVASGTAVSASQVSNLGGHIDGNGARAMFYAGQGNSIDGSFGGGLTLGGTWTLGGHTQLSALSDGHFTYLGGSVIDGAITAGKGSTAGTLQLSFGENASAVVQANSGVIVGNHSSASVHGTLNGDVVVDTQQGNPSGLSAGANLTVAGTHNGRLSMDGAARVTVSGTQNGVVKLDAGALTLSDSVLNISDGSTWTGGTITGTGAAQINVGTGATWAISGADKTLTGTALNVQGSVDLGTTRLTLDQPLNAAAGSHLGFSASGNSAGQFGRITAPSITLDPTGVGLSLTTAGGYTLAMGDQFTVLTATDSPAAKSVFSSGTINVNGPANYLIAPTKTATDLTLAVSNFIPIGLPGTTVAGIVGAGGISGYVAGQTAAGLQSFLASAGAASTTPLPTSPITLP